MLGSPLLALLLTIASISAIFGATDLPVIDSLWMLFIIPVQDLYGLSELALKMTPTLLCALGLYFCFTAGVWNIGAEGQFILGAIVAAWVALNNPANSSFGILLVLFGGILGGTFWAAIAAFLKNQFHASEVLTTIMLNYIALHLLMYMLTGPLQDPSGYNFPESALLPDQSLIPHISSIYAVNWMFPVAIILTATCWWAQRHTLFMFKLRLKGKNVKAAIFSGVDPKKSIWITLLLSGAFAGLAGASELAGPVMQLTPQAAAGYGYLAIIVAFLGRLDPLGILIASALMALIQLGSQNLQLELSLPVSIALLFQALTLFLLLSCDVLIRYRINWDGFMNIFVKW